MIYFDSLCYLSTTSNIQKKLLILSFPYWEDTRSIMIQFVLFHQFLIIFTGVVCDKKVEIFLYNFKLNIQVQIIKITNNDFNELKATINDFFMFRILCCKNFNLC